MKRLLILTMTTILLLSGCGFQAGDPSGSCQEAGGISSDTVLATVDGQKITAGPYFYWLGDACDYIADSMGQVDWKTLHDGQTLAEYAMERALRTVSLYAVIEAWASRYDCALTDGDQEKIDAAWKNSTVACGGEAALENLGISQETARRFSKDYCLYAHLYQLFCTKGSKLCPAQPDVDLYVKDSGLMTVDDMFFSTADAADDQARAKKRAKAESVLAQLRSASDPVSAFTSLADKNSEDPKREEHPSGITFAAGDGTLPQTVDDAAASLKENTLSDVVETKDGYYLLIRKPLDQKAAAASYFDHLLQTAADSATIQKTAAYSQINVADFYKKLTAARTASGDKSSSSASSG